MGVEARCPPCHSAAHCRHMKRQPCLCHHHPHHGHGHCNHRRHLCHCCQLCCHHRCHCPLLLLSAIAVAVAVNHCRHHLCCITVSHRLCRCRHPCCWPLLSPSPSAIAVAISVGHHHHRHCWSFPRVVAWAWQELYSTNWSKECSPYFILFGQWAAHWSKLDDWLGVRRRWPTPALGVKRRAVSS